MGLDDLGNFLIERGWVRPEDLEEARRTQEFFGGQLASFLLRMGFIDEPRLALALSHVTGAPYASWRQLRFIEPEAKQALPAALVRKHKVCPFRLQQGTLSLAMLDPKDTPALAEIRKATQLQVDPWVTCEYRLNQALERHYKVKPPEDKVISLGHQVRRTPSDPKPVRAPDPEPSAGLEGDVGLDGLPLAAEVSVDELLYPSATPPPDDDPTLEPPAAAASTPSSSASSPAAPPLRVLEDSLVKADSREGLLEAVMDFAHTRAARAAFFAVTRQGIRCVAARGRGLDPRRVRDIRLAPEPGSVLGFAASRGELFYGAVPPVPANRDIYTVLGGILPAMALIVPIHVKGRLTALLYLDEDDRPMSQPEIPLMRRVAAKVGLGLELLLLKQKLRQL